MEFDHVEGTDQLAVAHGHFKMTLALPGSAAPMAVDGKFLDTFRKDLQGKWRCASVTYNSNVPSALRAGAGSATTAPLQATSFMPNLTVNDLAQSITFFEALGMVVTDRWEDQGRLLGVLMGAGVFQLGLAQDDWSKGRNRTKGIGCSTWIETGQSLDQLADRVKAAGFKVNGPYDTPWGNRAFDVTSAEGFALTVATPMKPQS
jgi:predicted lactoylglutathione lyase